MKKTYFAVLLLITALLIQPANAEAQTYNYQSGQQGITLDAQNQSKLSLRFSINSFELSDFELKGEKMKQIQISGNFLPNNEGAPDLPGFSRYIAIPEGATASLKVKSFKTETIKNIDIAPAPRIPLDTETGPLQYEKNSRIYSENSFYPSEPVQISHLTEIRGVDAVMLGITPFQYNPVSGELLVYYNIELEISFEGGSGYFGEERLRSHWFDPVLEDAFLNYEQLPDINYHRRMQQLRRADVTGYEYLIVVPNNTIWMPYAEQIRDFRTEQGISTGIVTLNEIGGNSATILENYFNNAYNTWDIPPVAVLLMADYGSNADNSIISPIWDSYCASDNIFADVNNNDMPDIIFARMTAQNETHLQTMVSKMLDYESNPPTDGNFYHKPITALGWQTERWFQICSETVGGYWREVKGKEPVRINAIYSGTPGTTWSTATNTSTVVNYFGPSGQGYIPATPAELGGWSGGTGQDVINAINDGAFALQHRDHGGTTGWGEPDFQSSDINSLTNTSGNELVFVFSINCLTGKYNMSGECFTEKFHRHTYSGQNAGALGLIAASEVSYSFVNDTYVWGMFDNMNPDFLPDYGPFVDERGFLPAFGNAAGKYFLQQSSWPYNTGSKEVTYNLFHHHGGAFMQVYSEVPQNLSVTHNPILYSGETSFSVSANAGSMISLTVDGEIIGTGEGTGSPVNITIEPQIPPAEMLVTVTKQNHFRYQSAVEVIPPEGPYVVFNSYEINDYTDNNGNGQVDYGETIWLTMTLENVGVENALGVDATIASADPYVTITTGQSSFGDIPAAGTVTVTDAFIFDAGTDIPDGHQAAFTLVATDNASSEWTSYFGITGHAPSIELEGYFVDDSGGNNNGILDPGETAPVEISLINNGGADAYNVSGALSDSDPYLNVITLDPQDFGDLATGSSGISTFTVSADAGTPGGHLAEALMDITADFGITQQEVIEFSFADYCMPTANCSYGDGFTGFSLEQISNMNNGCSPDGYGDFTDMTAELEPGQTYTVSWSTGYSNQDVCLWIDLDNDREFEESERLITDFNLASAGTVYTTNFTVPDVVYPGNKRLRIRGNWQNSAADPCANFTYGETEDYTAFIGTYLAPPLNLEAEVVDHDVSLTWDAPPAEALLGYNVYRNASMLAEEITATTYLDEDLASGTYAYTVTAVYTEGESQPAGPVSVQVGGPEIAVDPTSFDISLEMNTNTDQTLNVLNYGDAELTYSASVEYLELTKYHSPVQFGQVVKSNTKSSATDASPFVMQNMYSDAIGDILIDFDIQTPASDNQLLGCEFDGTYLWFTGGGNSGTNKLYKFDVSGNLIQSYNQGTTSDWGMRDMAFDGSYLYAGDESGFYRIDPASGSVTTLFTGSLGLGAIRAIAFNANTGYFYAANWDTQIVEFDESGNQISTLNAPGLSGMYGLAYHEDENMIWIHDRTGSPQTTLYEYDVASQSLTGTSIQVPMLSGLSDQINGGIFLTDDLVSGKLTIGGVVQGTDVDKFFAMDMGDLVTWTWLTITANGSGSVPAGESADVALLFDATDLAIGEYTAEIFVESNDVNNPSINVPVTLTVTDQPVFDADFTGDPLSGEAPLTVQFTDASQGNPVDWEWDFNNDGTIDSYEQNPQYTYNTPGQYSVKLTIYDAAKATDTELKENYITVTPVDNYFEPVWTSPYNPMNVFVMEATIDGTPLQSGDEIGLFDIDPNTGEEICVGYGVLVEPLGGTVYLEIIASMDDGSNPDQANGFTPGNPILYRLWSLATGEVTSVSSAYPYPGYDEEYTAQGTAFVELAGLLTYSQTLSLQTGWNMMSMMVEPANMDMLSIVQPLIDQEVLYKVIDEAGGTVFHLPFPPPNGQWSNTIGDMACTEGYYIKLTGDADLTVEGSPAAMPMDIPLIAGWNMISYPCLQAADAMEVVQPLIDADVLYKVIDEAGGTVFHLPFPPPNGQWSNTIGNFENGEGYYIKVTEDAILTMAEPAKAAPVVKQISSPKTNYFQPVFSHNPYMPMHFAFDVNGRLNPGDELAVFDGDVCVGATTFEYGNTVIVTTSMDEPGDEVITGFNTGNLPELKIWNSQNNQVIEHPETEFLGGEITFAALASKVQRLTDVSTGTSGSPADHFEIGIFPNPVTDELTINTYLPLAGLLDLEICDMFGKPVKKITEDVLTSGNHQITTETGTINSGYYLIKYIFNSGNEKINGYIKCIVIHE